jgi:hypothetical protein
VAHRKTKKDWGTVLLQMALDARQEGDLVTAELLVAHAMDYFDEADRLASRWRKVEARLDDRRHIGSVVPDSKYPNMWHARLGDGALTDMANLSRAKDAATALAIGSLNDRQEVA